MRARSAGLAILVLGAVASCSGGGDDPIDAAMVDAASPDAATAIDAADPDGASPDARIDAAGSDGGLDPLACGTGTAILPLPMSGTVTGAASATTPGNVASTTCNGRGAETAYVFTVTAPVTLDATTDVPATTLDTVLYIRRACQDPMTELACADDVAVGNPRSHLTVDLTPGTYYLIVDGRNVGSAGAYTLTVRLSQGPGAPCAGPLDCAPGFTCRAIPPSTQTTCQPPVCDDGRDDDGDGQIDYPDDAGCTSPADDTEDDACPGAPGCPACADGVDNDGDALVDYPIDTGCVAASATSEESCAGETDPLVLITAGTTTGTTSGASNQLMPTCVTNSNAPERVHTLRVRLPLASLVIDTDTSPFDTVVSLLDNGCATTLACDDDSGAPTNQSRITRGATPAGTYAIAVDGFGAAAGAYQLHVAGTYAAGALCDPTVPYFRCGVGFACAGPPTMERCVAAVCNDAIDEDGDTFVGYPTDPGCTSPSDPDESDDCPTGPMCPACGNGVDDDGDGPIDYPADSGCAAAGATAETCASVDPLRALTASVTGQATGALADDAHPTCGLDGRDEVWQLVLTRPLAELRLDTIGSTLDAVLAVKASSCAAVDLACDDNSAGSGDARVLMTNVAAGTYAVVVDDRGTAVGTYNLNLSGRYPDGGACDPASTVFTCRTGFVCAGATPTCVPTECNDAVDADGDGAPGFPTDPGCASIVDDDEADACPAGPGCPACGNDVDDDGDGAIDYPADSTCLSASAATEQSCAVETNPLLTVPAPVTTGTTVGATNDFVPACITGTVRTAPDRVHLLTVQVPVASLTLDTTGSGYDTVLMFADASCAPVLACDDDAGPGTTSLITRTAVAPGAYAVIVDGFAALAGAYTLNVRGTLPAGGSCADPLVAAGVLACPTGTTCQAGVCAP